ncbi:pyridoxamine 5'-phosphate oxidase family protein [Mucilaginibacter pedocola]|uniref:Pyridoxamine 5'-phosphate oxidase n=1 Tax=Mucilaginibacter pedocola TaxID=1792845 RepID=A0A1S9PKR3_9SPHI|nr:pyridoxamine 5'-phosphate oxidase family protein [Mucilaginibacter pedocola]OOQ61138.1 pyridoxamine 5'-phosphate oxidase [Mucilaginibacter pedocola]
MAKFFEEIGPRHREFIEAQKIFFTASAPLSGDGHVNLSPKGMDAFRVLSPNKVAYMDINGSGNETSAHLLENGRITIMFCAFDGPPNILRLYGKGYTVLPGTSEWDELSPLFHLPLSSRQIIVTNVDIVQTSCGYGVPFYDYKGERDQAIKWAENKGEEGIEKYQAEKNRISLDGLPTAMFDRF